MEGLFLIKEQFPLAERSYTDRNGQPQIFVSKAFILTNGVDSFFAEATGEYVRSLGQMDESLMHMAQTQMSVRDYTDKDGNTRYQTEIRIVRIV